MSRWKKFLFFVREGRMPSESDMVSKKAVMIKDSDQSVRSSEMANLVDCIRVYTRSTGDMEQSAFEMIKKIARTFSDWMMVRQSVSPTSSLGIFASEQLPAMAKTFDDWENLHQVTLSETVGEMALNKMAAMAHSREEQVRVYDIAPVGSSIKVSMFGALKLQAKNLEDWKELLGSSDDNLKKFAIEMILNLASSEPSSVAELLSESEIEDDPDLVNKVLEKIRGMSADFGTWKDLYGETENDELKAIVRSKMIEAAKTVEDLNAIDEVVDDDGEDEAFNELLGAKARLVLVTDEACAYIMDNFNADCVLFETAFEYVLGKASSLKECFELFTSLHDEWKTEDDEPSEVLVEKVTEKILSLATPNEMLLISKLGSGDDEYEELANAAEEKLGS